MSNEIENDSHPDVRSAAFLKALNGYGGTSMEKISPDEARKVLEGAQKNLPIKTDDVGFRN
jgi:hypothetical protein